MEINLLRVLAALSLSLIGGAGGQFGPLAFQMIQRKGEHLIRDGAILELHPKITNKDMYIYISKLLFCPPNYLTDLDELFKYLLSTIKIFLLYICIPLCPACKWLKIRLFISSSLDKAVANGTGDTFSIRTSSSSFKVAVCQKTPRGEGESSNWRGGGDENWHQSGLAPPAAVFFSVRGGGGYFCVFP